MDMINFMLFYKKKYILSKNDFLFLDFDEMRRYACKNGDIFRAGYLARARARPTVGSPAPVRRGLWSLPSSCPSSRTTGRFLRAPWAALGASWALHGRLMGALFPHGAEREF